MGTQQPRPWQPPMGTQRRPRQHMGMQQLGPRQPPMGTGMQQPRPWQPPSQGQGRSMLSWIYLFINKFTSKPSKTNPSNRVNHQKFPNPFNIQYKGLILQGSLFASIKDTTSSSSSSSSSSIIIFLLLYIFFITIDIIYCDWCITKKYIYGGPK